MEIRYDEAMHRLHAGKQYGCADASYEGITWMEVDEPMPSKEELEAEWENIKAEILARDLDNVRTMAYPDIKELVVALWEKLVEKEGLTSPAIKAIQKERKLVKKNFKKEK